MIWNKTMECMPRDQLRALQDERLKDLVRRVYENVPFYRDKMQQLGITPKDIHGVCDIELLPFTTKQDLRDHYPFGLFAVPQSEIVRIHASSGTTGKPTVVGYTGGDIDRWAELMARSMYCANVGKNDIVQVAYGYGLFTGGLGAHYGAERVGASVIPISGGNTTRQLMIMQDFGTTAICCTPSYALNLAEAMEAEGIKPAKLKSGIFGAEPWTESMRVKIEEMLGIDALNVYGLSEVMGPGVSMECMCKNGMHIWEDHF
ncbi:MAG: phenylacetate--CoA ligase, partial [Eubacteriales bacterium]|nr:phenylacetate--CoA ligase [Eubacteriales bacterium]